MPELPEVTYFKKYIDSTSLHQKIKAIQFRVPKLLQMPQSDFEEALIGHELTEIRREGKYVLVKSSSGKWLVFHFGMTGKPDYYRHDSTPHYAALILNFGNGANLAFTCPRKLGKLYIVRSPEDFKKERSLGKDALTLSWKEFEESFKDKKGSIKSALMDQSVLSGVGNLYSDEALFQSQIHPKTKVSKLTQEELKTLFENLQNVLRTVTDCRTEDKQLPQDYLTPHRKEGGNCPSGNGELKRIKVAGRSAYFCPACQKEKS